MSKPDMVLTFPNGCTKEFPYTSGVKGCREDGQRPIKCEFHRPVPEHVYKAMRCVLHPCNREYVCVNCPEGCAKGTYNNNDNYCHLCILDKVGPVGKDGVRGPQ